MVGGSIRAKRETLLRLHEHPTSIKSHANGPIPQLKPLVWQLAYLRARWETLRLGTRISVQASESCRTIHVSVSQFRMALSSRIQHFSRQLHTSRKISPSCTFVDYSVTAGSTLMSRTWRPCYVWPRYMTLSMFTSIRLPMDVMLLLLAAPNLCGVWRLVQKRLVAIIRQK